MKKAWLVLSVLLLWSVSANAQRADSVEFDDCMVKAGKIGDDALAVCFKDEAKRNMQKIKDIYEGATQVDVLAKWSGSKDMKTGNLRNMFEAWLGYRNMFCSFSGAGNTNYAGTEDYNNSECIHTLTKQHLIDMTVVVHNSNSYLYDFGDGPEPTK